MRTRRLGASGIIVSEVGFGAWGIGGDKGGAVAYGPADERASLDAIDAALDAGINFFDTADFYGFGESERVIGKALAGRRQKAVIASKVGMVGHDGSQNFDPGHIRRSLDESLGRLGTDYVDLYQLHSPTLDLLRANPDILSTMAQLRDAGKVRAIGISLRSPEDGAGALDLYPFAALQVNFNLLDQRALELGLFERCAQSAVGVVVRTPLCFGYLTGSYTAEAALPPSDHRARWALEQRRIWSSAYGHFNNVREGSADTPAQFALRFCLSLDAVSTVIPGMLLRAHVAENSAAGERPLLADQEVKAITQTYQGHRYFVGR